MSTTMLTEVIAPEAVEAFIARWEKADGSERANYQMFASELCELIGAPKPDPAMKADEDNAYVFERNVTARFANGDKAARFIDLYKRNCFVLEAKQSRKKLGSKGQERTLEQAYTQAEQYARSLPAKEGRPPFIIVVDVSRSIDLYAEFSRSGGTYTAFPDARNHRITLPDLRNPNIQDRLRRLWTEPDSLDPANYSAQVTKQIADKLAKLAKSLEASGQKAEVVAGFLSRCLFTMFAEDVGLLPEKSFRSLLEKRKDDPAKAMSMVRTLWQAMDKGEEFSPSIEEKVRQFNGGLFHEADTLPLDKAQLMLLIEAAKADWRYVEPAIFGTLLERSLYAEQRHALGAHYTPRAYVERLVLPTVIEPLREEWKGVQGAAALLAQGKGKKAVKAAVEEIKKFHHRLYNLRVLDPACGSGNFLYVTMDHMKRLEAEVLAELGKLGQSETFDTEGLTVSPHQLLGIELNPRAAKIAELVLWIGYLQWHHKTFNHLNVPEPILRDLKNIENRDAVLAYDRVEQVIDTDGKPVTRWDGRTMKKSSVTGEDIPDETARVPLERYINPRKAEWPQADFVVGNPPFIGTKRMKAALGDGYVEALRKTWQEVPESADLVMYWWDHAANLLSCGGVQRFGFITTNSLRQTFNREVLRTALEGKQPVSLAFAIPDHPWVDSNDGAAVRIAMTVASAGRFKGQLVEAIQETEGENGEVRVELLSHVGIIHSDLRIGADVASASALRANEGIAGMGVALHGSGFILDTEEVRRMQSQGASVIKPYLGGRDLLQERRERYLIDFSGMTQEQAREANSIAFQHVIDHVKPERDHNNRKVLKELWWRFGWERPVLRRAIAGLARYIATTETSKHRPFQFIDGKILCDHSIVCIALDDAAMLGMLSSTVHVTWAMGAGGRLGVGNDPRYNKTRCFDPFPFPDAANEQAARIRNLAEQLDAHRKKQQAAHSSLTLTGMYNVLEKLRSGEALTDKERAIHEQGLVSILRQLHDELDAAVLDAYGWADLLPQLRIAHGNESPPDGQTREDAKRAFDETILERLVVLNAERAAEEAKGLIRWLRPEFQNPQAGKGATPQPEQGEMAVSGDANAIATPASASGKALAWPGELLQQFNTIRTLLAEAPHTPDSLSRQFKGKDRTADIAGIFAVLESQGQIGMTDDGRYALV